MVCWSKFLSKKPGTNHLAQETYHAQDQAHCLSTQDVDATARFYIDVFGMKEIAKLDGPGLKATTSATETSTWPSSISRMTWLQVLNAAKTTVASTISVSRLKASRRLLRSWPAGSQPRDDVNQALGVGPGRANHGNVEVKYSGPDGVMLDVSQTGWVGTSGLDY